MGVGMTWPKKRGRVKRSSIRTTVDKLGQGGSWQMFRRFESSRTVQLKIPLVKITAHVEAEFDCCWRLIKCLSTSSSRTGYLLTWLSVSDVSQSTLHNLPEQVDTVKYLFFFFLPLPSAYFFCFLRRTVHFRTLTIFEAAQDL